MKQSTPLPPPPRRALAFADAVRRRVRPLRGRARVRGWAAGFGRPAIADQVLRRSGRTSVVQQHRHAGTRVDVRLAVAFDLGGRRRSGGPRTVWRTVATPVLRRARTAAGPGSETRPGQGPARIELLAARAAATSPNALPPRVPATISFPALVGRRDAATTAPQRPASPVAMTYRGPVPAAPATARPSTPATPGSAQLHWLAEVPAATGTTALTAADLPAVIDRVVGELDRRVTAARERRGWTA